jgi:hypothetical protein
LLAAVQRVLVMRTPHQSLIKAVELDALLLNDAGDLSW